ncbi:DUF6074 family protein [Phenylobacterium terrae]|uniref:DUF6074 family protein n=1 Tax=Phenylobacterium terrae TaxID=2665495 RepID=A0ABW4N527_9CAUL
MAEAEMLCFPLAQRRGFVRRQASWFCEQSAKAAEHNLFRQLQLQRDTLLRKGVDAAKVEREVAALERAIRREVVRLTCRPEIGA